MFSLSKKSLLIFGLVAILLLASVSFALAQGNGNSNGGNGNGANGANGNNPQAVATCVPAQNQAGMTNSNQNQYGTANQSQAMNGNQVQAGNGDCPFCPIGEPVDVELSEAVIEAMTRGLLDEYAAYDTYGAIITQFGEVQAFANIQNAEAMHIAAWERLFMRYGLSLPERPTVDVPSFATITEACAWAYDIEINNAGLYDELLVTLADYPDMLRVVNALRDASLNNHAPAFENCAGQ